MNLDQIGKYKIVNKIGQGATGEVFRAHDPVLNRFVAVKTLSASIGADEERLKRFRREAQSAAKLNHPNIITVYDFGEELGHLYMAMELLEGRDLSDVIRSGELGIEESVGLMEQICDALAFAHAAGVVHRDLKPANIHVLPDGQAKVMDFGLARLGGSSEMTRAGAVMGTPNYMAPEQVRGERVDARADVFSLGAVFHEMLSGQKAFEADSLHGVLYKVLDENPQPLSLIAPDVPAPLAALVERALDKDAARRFRDAGEMRDALRRWRDAGADLDATVAGADSTLAPEVPSGAEATHLDPRTLPTHPSLARSRTRPPVVTGATALDLRRAAAARTDPRLRETPRAAPTLSGRAATRVEEGRPARSRGLLYAGIGGAALVVAVAGVYVALRFGGERPPTSDVSREQAGVLSDALVESRVELARVELQNKNYEGAIRQAEQALAVQAENADARGVVAEARKRIAERDSVAAEARAAFDRGDTAQAAQALGRLLALDPRHPVAGELTVALNQYFTKQAEDARNAMQESRAAAQRLNPQGAEGYPEAQALAKEAERLLSERQYAVATQKFMESRDRFEQARRAAEIAAQKAQMAAARPVEPAGRPPIGVPTAPPPVTAGTMPPPPVTSPVGTLPPATLPPTGPGPSGAGQDAAIRRVIADYARAIESKDVGLFKSVKPNLSADEEKRLQDAFKAIKSQQVGITVDSVQLDGSKATVRVRRQDTVNGKAVKPIQQTITLVQAGGAWHIETIGQ
jgi:tRNA A-37 threonylcarbamoyl transferase component Bud32/tetratricopeptide (TPR) repeat protein